MISVPPKHIHSNRVEPRRAMRFTLVLFALLSFSACSSKDSLRPELSSSESAATKVVESELVEPFSFELLKELKAGPELVLFGEVRSKREWMPSEVLLRVRSFGKEGMHGQYLFPLAEFLSDSGEENSVRRAEEVAQFALRFPIQRAEDYQLELIWGELAESLQNQALSQFIELEPAEFDLSIGEAALSEPLSVSLKNRSRAFELRRASLVLQARVEGLDLDSPIFQDGQLFELTGLLIGPLKSEKVSVDLEEYREFLAREAKGKSLSLSLSVSDAEFN